jgi:uncharacterized membrane protein
MTRRHRKQRGGEMNLFEDAALVGLGAYAARNPNAPWSSVVLNVAKYTLYFFAFIFFFFLIVFILVLIFAPKGSKAPTTTPDQTTKPPATK